jgi:hypothetical protein
VDDHPPGWIGQDEIFGRKPLESLTNRRSTDAEIGSDTQLDKPTVWREGASDDLVLEPSIDDFTARQSVVIGIRAWTGD